jgi:hypothetical protein
MGWPHEEGRAPQKRMGLREVRLKKERASAEAIAQQLADKGVEATVEQPNGSVYLRVHRFVQIVFRYRAGNMRAKPCEGVTVVSKAPKHYKLPNLKRYYALDWTLDVPQLVNAQRAADTVKKRLTAIRRAESEKDAKHEEERKFHAAVRASVEAAGFQADAMGPGAAVYLTAERDIRSKGNAPAFQVHLAVTEDKQAHLFLKCRIPPQQVGALATALNELVLEHGLRLM